MAWVRVSDDFYDHPKFTEAGPLGVAQWLAGMAYCNRNLTDGLIPKAKARGLLDYDGIFIQMPDGEVTEAAMGALGDYASTVLVISYLWHEDGHDCPSCPQPGPRHYYVHDYLEYQPSKAQVEETRAVRAAAGRKGGQAKQSARQDAKQLAKQPAKQNSKQNGSKSLPQSQVPIPNPIPSPNPLQDSITDQSVPQMVPPVATDLTSVARFRKFDPEAVRTELARVIPDPKDDEVARVATTILDKAPGAVRNPTRYIVTAILNDEYSIEDIAYGYGETA